MMNIFATHAKALHRPSKEDQFSSYVSSSCESQKRWALISDSRAFLKCSKLNSWATKGQRFWEGHEKLAHLPRITSTK